MATKRRYRWAPKAGRSALPDSRPWWVLIPIAVVLVPLVVLGPFSSLREEPAARASVFVLWGVLAIVAAVLFIRNRQGSDNTVDYLLMDWARARGRTFSSDYEGITLPARGYPFDLPGNLRVLRVSRGVVRGRDTTVLYMARGAQVSSIYGGVTEVYTVVAVNVGTRCPIARIEPKKLGDNARYALDETFELESADFNERWRLTAEDWRSAHAIFTPKVIDRLNAADTGDFAVSWDGSNIIAAEPFLDGHPESLDNKVDLLLDLADAVPAYQVERDERTDAIAEPVVAAKAIATLSGPEALVVVGAIAVSMVLFGLADYGVTTIGPYVFVPLLIVTIAFVALSRRRRFKAARRAQYRVGQGGLSK